MKPRLAWQIFSLEMRNLLHYRVDFWVNWLLGTAAHLGVAWFLWEAIYGYTGKAEIGGFAQKTMMLYYTLAVMVDRAIQGAGSHNVSTDIYEGTLNRYLLYPVPLFRYKMLQGWAHTLFYLGQGMLLYFGFLLIFGLPDQAPLDAAALGMGIAAIFTAAALFLGLSMVVEQVAFWADNVWSLSVMLQFIMRLAGGVMVPLALFPQQAQDILHWLPFSAMVSFPIRSILGQLSFYEWLQGMALLAAWLLVAWAAALLVWRRGTLRYTGVGI